MRPITRCLTAGVGLAVLALATPLSPALAADDAQIGPRPMFLVDDLPAGKLKDKLAACTGPFTARDFSIGHRGAAMQFPEHTRESYLAAGRQGAGIIECDVTFTKDKQLVCRHSQCDLATTTDILARPELAAKCSQPFTPADPAKGTKASATCCTSDLTLDEFMSLNGKMDAANPDATTAEAYMDATAGWRTDLYSPGTVVTHAQSIALIDGMGRKFTPELKGPSVDMPFDGGYSQHDYAAQMIEEYKAAGIDPKRVFAQSFNLDDVLYWIETYPEFGKQAVYLDGRYDIEGFDPMDEKTWQPSMQELADKGVNYLAPPLYFLVTEKDGKIVPSPYAKAAKKAGLKLITWTLERSGPLASGGGWYFQSIEKVTDRDSDTLDLLNVLAQDIGVVGVFSDWPATTTFYANCMNLD
ncbi:glycerophosphodiester phosphodiesterase family protein [Roseospirillum parvum]|uniref:glycerophosphodiester phosphodiesterase n=1 Tax=Roseospirillum parvum TaxID=83401 RepID=A0A1G7VYH8_9PROT|nr:glycerophosphodiester phosphodiesterase family protein [Roseospirillum parvum]SDG64825.1 glycerophosphoryl diester phosphodiesterase [Roseospirillum parvum]